MKRLLQLASLLLLSVIGYAQTAAVPAQKVAISCTIPAQTITIAKNATSVKIPQQTCAQTITLPAITAAVTMSNLSLSFKIPAAQFQAMVTAAANGKTVSVTGVTINLVPSK